MSDGLGSYRFLPWARRGLAAAIAHGPPEPPGSGEGRARLEPTLVVSKGGTTEDVSVDLPFYGPGDVVGIDARQIIRTDPRSQTHEFEPNYLAAIEFDSPYYPWLFSPDNSSTRMRPWLCLVVLRRDLARLSADPRRPLPSVSVRTEDAPGELPDLTQAWAWAHVQLTGAGDVNSALECDPNLTLSRLISPRRLEEGIAYLACLVPTFAAGRQAGLGQEVTAKDEPAWPPFPDAASGAEARFELPVYHHWEFNTGPLGDFEALVGRLDARTLGPDEVGARRMDLTTAGSSLPVPAPGEPGSTLGFEGALGVPRQRPTPWPSEPQEEFQTALRERLEAHPTPEATVLAPPVYGRSQAGPGDREPLDDGSPLWLRGLNLDPRYRGAAALGTRVVQELQEQLVAAAWDQAGQLERANDMLRHAQLARAVASAARATRLKPLVEEAPDALLRLTGPVHSRVRVGRDGEEPFEEPASGPGRPKTLLGSVRDSLFPQAAVSAPFRRVVRPAGPVGRRVPDGAGAVTSRMSRRLAKGEIEVPIKPSEGAVRFDEVEGDGRKLEVVRDNVGSARGWNKIAGHPDDHPFYIETARGTPEGPAPAATMERVVPLDAPPDGGDGGAEPNGSLERVERRLTGINERFREAAGAVHRYLDETATPSTAGLAAADPGRELALGSVGETLVRDHGPLDPERTVPEQVLPLFSSAPAGETDPLIEMRDPLAPRAAAPSFPQPMWDPLRRLSQDFLLPGAENIKPDTITLLSGNARFIEAYLVGLNHELGRELLWRGVPTDFGATYFRQFWDVRGRGPGGGATPVEDVPEIGSWSPEKGLGEHGTGVGGAGMLVLMIRGEVLRRYPTTAIHAVEAVWADDGRTRRRPGTREVYPEFRGDLEPDLVFLGFPLSIWEAMGSDTHPGWYFVLQEQPTAPRFGLDEVEDEEDPASFGGKPTSWNALHWGHLVTDRTAYDALRYVPVEGPTLNPELAGLSLDGARWGEVSTHMAEITLQRPKRVAVHAARMLGDAEEQALQVTRVSRTDGTVTAIAGPDEEGGHWGLTAPEAIDALGRAAAAFFLELEDAGRRKVLVGGTPEAPYLTTAGAPGEPNLLLELPEV